MFLDTAVAGGRRRRPTGRQWFAPAAIPVPDEPGWDVTTAAVSSARERLGLRQRWHDGTETSCSVARRALWRRGHGAKSGRYAAAFGELVHAFGKAGLFPRSGPPPRYGTAEWDEYLKRNRTQARRVCDRLEAAGLARVSGEKDNLGMDWRVVVELLQPALVDADRVKEAKRRRRTWSRRRDRSARRGVRRDLQVIAQSAKPLTGAEKRRLRLAAQRATADRFSNRRDLRHPIEASRPTAAQPQADSNETTFGGFTSNRRGARARGVPSLRSKFAAQPRARLDGSSPYPDFSSRRHPTNGEEGVLPFRGGQDETGSRRLAGVRGDSAALRAATGGAPPYAVFSAQIAVMAPAGAALSAQIVSAVVTAWWRLRRGLAASHDAVRADTATAAASLSALTRRSQAFEELAEHRPAGWPTSGAAALLTFAFIRDLSPTDPAFIGALDELLGLMTADRRHGGRPVTPPGSDGPPAVLAGYEGVATMHRRLTQQLRAAGDDISHHPTLAAAERAAIDHERAGRLPAGPAPDWNAPWNRDAPSPTFWPSPALQRRLRHRLLPPLPHAIPAPAAPDHLADPATYTDAAATIAAARPGRVGAATAEALVHAFHAHRYGINGAIARRHWRPRTTLKALNDVTAAYESFPDTIRPAGWPTTGVAALLHLATWRDPGSHTLDGKPVHMHRPEHLPMAIARLRVVIEEMRRHTERPKRIADAKRRHKGRGGRATSKTPAEPTNTRFQYRPPTDSPLQIAESPAETYQRIRRQLLASGRHPAEYPSLEEAELALIDLEHAGDLPQGAGPSPTAMRTRREEHRLTNGPAAIAQSEWDHLAAATAEHLPTDQAERLSEIQPVSIYDGRLILTAPPETRTWIQTAHLERLLQHIALSLNLAHSIGFIAPEHTSLFQPADPLRGPADHASARGDRYATERTHRYGVTQS